ncbi:hypothetical protein BCR42DRAFT_401508 [Absidia repens]|uniref:Uncharacterized protein n=1 Tax=Absidia repens TaxID=90262 RepID=A0A1X2J4B3_9FUNG|nr:hypothetical protein BCR42DRAFT_401508 [Absidia repens]
MDTNYNNRIYKKEKGGGEKYMLIGWANQGGKRGITKRPIGNIVLSHRMYIVGIIHEKGYVIFILLLLLLLLYHGPWMICGLLCCCCRVGRRRMTMMLIGASDGWRNK